VQQPEKLLPGPKNRKPVSLIPCGRKENRPGHADQGKEQAELYKGESESPAG
jgi:hypothetical protein